MPDCRDYKVNEIAYFRIGMGSVYVFGMSGSKKGHAMIRLSDDGTMDTVLKCDECGEEMRYNFDTHNEDCTDESGACGCYDEFVDWAIEDAEYEHECEQEEAQA